MLRLLERGRACGHEVTLIAPAASMLHQACAEAGIRSETAEFTFSPSAISGLRVVMHELRPDVVQGMSIFPVAYVRALGLVPADKPVAFFAYVSIDPTSTLPVAVRRFRTPSLLARNAISRWEAPRLDAIFTSSETVARRLGAAGIRGRIIPTPGRVDPERLAREATLSLELPPGRPRIGYAGFLEPLKGIDDLIVAFAEVVRAHPAATLLVAGEGPARSELLELARSLGIAENVELLGFLEPVAPMLAALDVFVSPSHSEALGTSILEAMALGVPVVCTDSGGPAEFIRSGDNGVLVPPSDSAAMAEAVLRLLGDPALAARLALSGRATALGERYLISTTLDTVFAEYERAADRRAGQVA